MDQQREQKEKPLNSFLSPSTPLPTSNIEYSKLATEGENKSMWSQLGCTSIILHMCNVLQ